MGETCEDLDNDNELKENKFNCYMIKKEFQMSSLYKKWKTDLIDILHKKD